MCVPDRLSEVTRLLPVCSADAGLPAIVEIDSRKLVGVVSYAKALPVADIEVHLA